jgi:preprotein translocase subunit SecA
MNKHREVFYKKRREILEKLKTENPDDENSLKSYILNIIKKFNYSEKDYNNREKELGQEMMRQLEKFVCIRVLDDLWIEHLENMEYLRDSVYLRAYGQKDPLVEYKSEGHRMFKQLLEAIELNIVNLIFKSEFRPQKRIEFKEKSDEDGIFKNVGRNDPCPCGAKKPDGTPVKFKHCHGK